MKEYLELCLQGESTIPQRKELLAEKRKALLGSIRESEDSVEYRIRIYTSNPDGLPPSAYRRHLKQPLTEAA